MLTDSLPKPRRDAKLKTLPDDRQAQIFEFARDHSLVQTVQWLAERQIKTSISAVSQFLRWYRVKRDLARSESELQRQLVDLVRKDPSAYHLHNLGQRLFDIDAIMKQDPHAWYRSQMIGFRRRGL